MSTGLWNTGGMNTRRSGLGAALLCAGAGFLACIGEASAQPTVLVVNSTPWSGVVQPAAGGVRWLRFSASTLEYGRANRYFDIETTALLVGDEPAMAVYDDTGVLVGLSSSADEGRIRRLSFGGEEPPRPAVDGGIFAGEHGLVLQGTHYLAIAAEPAVFAPIGWGASSASTRATDFFVSINSGSAYVPDGAMLESIDAGPLTTNAQRPVYDSYYSHGEVVAGTLTGMSDVDVYSVPIGDIETFRVELRSPLVDARLYIFDESGRAIAAGAVVSGEDPQLRSVLTGALLQRPGIYFIAVASRGREARSAEGAIWLPGGGDTERAPDGPGAGIPLAGWSTEQGAIGRYTMGFAGAAFPCEHICFIDYDLSGGVDGDDIGAFMNDWIIGAPCADVDRSGGVDNQDFYRFFCYWRGGGCGFLTSCSY